MKKMVSLFGCLVILTIGLAPSALAGIINKALALDGDGDYVEIPHSDSLKLTESLTIEMRIKAIPTSGGFVLISNPNWTPNEASSTGNYSIIVYRDSHEIEFSYQPLTIGDHVYIASNGVLNDEFNHLAVVHTFGDGNSTKIFLNGTQLSGSWIQGTGDEEVLINNDPVQLGACDMCEVDFWNGLIDEVRIWKVARTQGQIKRWMNRRIWWHPEGLVGYWRMDDPLRSRTAKDYSGNGNDGTLMGDAHFVFVPKAQAAPSTRSTNFPKIIMTWGHLKAKH